MRIGTISFPREGENQAFQGRKQTEYVLHALKEFKPDLLVCSGHSIKNHEELKWLVDQAPKGRWATLVEVEDDDRTSQVRI